MSPLFLRHTLCGDKPDEKEVHKKAREWGFVEETDFANEYKKKKGESQ